MKGRLISSDPYRQQFLVERAVSFSHRQRDCSELISVLPRQSVIMFLSRKIKGKKLRLRLFAHAIEYHTVNKLHTTGSTQPTRGF
ncbi:hypothetical protein ACLD3S_13795, partial [Salmonella sp. 741265086_PSA]|uniref:hypothetical protein n=1 Tax=Salmonella sp. 741265086_PSA TaxID=3389009 RepID=UPI00397F56EF